MIMKILRFTYRKLIKMVSIWQKHNIFRLFTILLRRQANDTVFVYLKTHSSFHFVW